MTLLIGQLGGQGCADGPPPSVRIGGPGGIARGSDGQLYLSDSGCGAIRRFDPATGALTTVAGFLGHDGASDGRGSAARFSDPAGLAADNSGNLFVADIVNFAIRRVVIATGDVTTVAGALQVSGSSFGPALAARFKAPQHLAYDGASNSLYVSDVRNADVRRVDLTNAQVTSVAEEAQLSGSASGYSAPAGLALDGNGQLYVGDYQFIRRIDLGTLQVTNITGPTALSGAYGIALDGPSHLFAGDGMGDRLREVDLATDQVTEVAGTLNAIDYRDGVGSDARFHTPGYVLVDVPGHAYVSDEGNYVLRGVDIATGTVTTVAGTATRPGYQDGVGSGVTMGDVGFIYSDGLGNLYMTDWWADTVRKVVIATGEMTTIAGQALSSGSSDGQGAAARFSAPTGITGDGAGNLYVADGVNRTIRRIVLSTGEVTTIAATLYNPQGLACDGTNLYISDQSGTVIRQLVLATGTVTTLAGQANIGGYADGIGSNAQFDNARALVSDGLGNLFIADYGTNAVRKLVLATGQVTTYARGSYNQGFADGSVNTAIFAGPWDIGSDGNGHLYVADLSNHLVRRIDIATQTVTTVVGTPNGASGVILGPLSTARLNTPKGVAVLPGGTGVAIGSEQAILIARF